jgi:RimJ/RimL family protein N-acetyltransferase
MDAQSIPTLETERLRLRALRGSDFEDYAALYAGLDVVRLIGGGETWDRDLPSIRVAERIGERLEARIEQLGRTMLRYGLDRASSLAEVAPPGLARRAG